MRKKKNYSMVTLDLVFTQSERLLIADYAEKKFQNNLTAFVIHTVNLLVQENQTDETL